MPFYRRTPWRARLPLNLPAPTHQLEQVTSNQARPSKKRKDWKLAIVKLTLSNYPKKPVLNTPCQKQIAARPTRTSLDQRYQNHLPSKVKAAAPPNELSSLTKTIVAWAIARMTLTSNPSHKTPKSMLSPSVNLNRPQLSSNLRSRKLPRKIQISRRHQVHCQLANSKRRVGLNHMRQSAS